jgi:hypothetical protein
MRAYPIAPGKTNRMFLKEPQDGPAKNMIQFKSALAYRHGEFLYLAEFSKKTRQYGIQHKAFALHSGMRLGQEIHQQVALYDQLPIAPHNHPLALEFV